MSADDLAQLRADLEARGIVLPASSEPADDALIAQLWSTANTYDVIRKRVAAGGPAWEPRK